MSHDGTGAIPPYQPANQPPGAAPGALTCPKCGGTMRTYDRNGIHIEQCTTCRGVFLDFGELEHLTQLEARMAAAQVPPMPQQPPPGYGYDGPGWGQYGNHRYRKGGFSRLFFSS